jgi:predicted GNAT superfamily acetyltransferase
MHPDSPQKPELPKTPITIRDLRGLHDYQAVVDLEREIWGYTDSSDLVTIPVFIITVKRGGILIGAFDPEDRMIGFAFSIVGFKNGSPTQWSHMMGVVPAHRQSGLGRRLKLAQRDRALAAGFDLMEWTFDPLQALNAHLNFARLGVTCDEYVENLYGDSTSALHRGTPTDRFVVQWWLREPHVERRIAAHGPLSMRASEAAEAPTVNQTAEEGKWRAPRRCDLSVTARRVWAEVPTGFTEMQQEAPDLALDWRLQTREIFETYFSRGYRAVDFELQRERGRGRYLLAARD